MSDNFQMIQALHKLVPASKDIVPDRFRLTADNVFKSLDAAGLSFNIKKLSSGDWDLESATLTDKEIFDRMSINEAGHQGKMMIHTAACSRYSMEDFSCNSDRLENFIKNYDIEMFFDGDVIMICEESKTLTVYHHGGVFAHIRLV